MYDLMFKMATSLKRLHNYEVCHFDIKEANIFMMNKYTPVLSDLGLTNT